MVWGDASHTGWGALCEGRPDFCLWSKEEGSLHINCLEMLAVCGAHHGLIASKDNSHCLTYSSKDMDALAHNWSNLLLYAFPPIALIPQVIRRIREHKHKVILVAPLWRNQHWFSKLSQRLTAAPGPIPLGRDLLSQTNRMMWHPRPELLALHLLES